MRWMFYETKLIFGLNALFWVFSDKMGPKTRKTGPSSSKKGKKWLNWSKIVQSLVRYILDFSEATRFFMGSVAYRFQDESEPVILSYFLWHFIVG